jgi:ADP-ribose pyrophosphatase YjhB (NUDIX family)/predicted transcriptional regulator
MKDTLPEMQLKLLNKLMFSSGSKYSELEQITDNHDLFNYHLKELQTKELLTKDSNLYQLTEKGRQLVALMEEDGELQQQIKAGIFIDLIRYKDGKPQLLLYKRLKHPHYGYSGAVTGKLKWGTSLEENLKREMDEELGVVPLEYKIIGAVRELFRNEQLTVVGDGVYFVIVVTKWQGEPRESGLEGEYYWYDIDRILELDKIFRSGFILGLPHLYNFLKDPDHNTPYVIENGSDGLKY